MKKQITLSALLFLCVFSLKAQTEFKPGGSGIGTLFFNYKYDLSEGVDKVSSFNIERAYLGYKYDFTQNISARVIYDIGYDANVKTFTAFAKNAFIDWGVAKHLKLSVGLIPLKHFDYNDKFWGYRYIMKTATDEYGMGTTADLGINAEIPVSDKLSFNLMLLNGEGFKAQQDNFGLHKIGGNVTVKPVDGLSFRLHYDMMPAKYQPVDTLPELKDQTISVFTAFAGYEVKDLFRIGAEYNLMNNATQFTKAKPDHDLSAISVFGTYIFNPKWEVFARYDLVQSNTLEGATEGWNSHKDGSLIMGGVQYRVTKGVSLALNYRNFTYKMESMNPNSGIYLNLGMAF